MQSEAERLVLYKKCEELAASELSLRSQVQMYSDRYQEFQNAIQQSSQMVTSCHSEIEKMGKKIKKLEKERNDFRHRWEIAEQNQRKASEDVRISIALNWRFPSSDLFFLQYKLLEKEKRQSETKLDKLDKLSRALQQERSELQATIKNLSKPSATTENARPTPSTTAVNGHDASKTEPVETVTTDTNGSTPTPDSPNLYGSLFAVFFCNIHFILFRSFR